MNTYGSRRLALQFGSRCFEYSFLFANVSMPILGSDFLRHKHLLVDVAGSRLLDSSTLESIPAISSSSSNSRSDLYTALLFTPEEFRGLLSKYPDVICSKGFFTTDPKHSVRHTVPTLLPGQTVFADLMQKSWNLQERSLRLWNLQESSNVFPLLGPALYTWWRNLMVPGDRPCGDYHGLNTQTIPDRYPLPNIADFSARLHGSKVFTKLDLTKGYYQVPMSTGDIP